MVSVSGICAKRVAVSARHHILGRLASILAKELLNGQKLVVMIPHKIKRGAAALARLKAYERIPATASDALKDLHPNEPEALSLTKALASVASPASGSAAGQQNSSSAMAIDDEPQPPQPFEFTP
ncbi:hypothetical protein Goarm_012429 [Gossypium armourianum]|uniref:Uncharacterized protein n=1 Tax=Gossypium armourianum TaxID=34283 RepID=A0A7J9J0M6_9ROSI|nr:hypothetical protein [Gossypium armourianum]